MEISGGLLHDYYTRRAIYRVYRGYLVKERFSIPKRTNGDPTGVTASDVAVVFGKYMYMKTMSFPAGCATTRKEAFPAGKPTSRQGVAVLRSRGSGNKKVGKISRARARVIIKLIARWDRPN